MIEIYVMMLGLAIVLMILAYQIDKLNREIRILRRRDNLNSNKTPKEFCKNKKELEE